MFMYGNAIMKSPCSVQWMYANKKNTVNWNVKLVEIKKATKYSHILYTDKLHCKSKDKSLSLFKEKLKELITLWLAL
jgi:hypothetical protein